MSTKALLEDLRRKDVRLEADGLTLRVDAPDEVDSRGAGHNPSRAQVGPDPAPRERTPQAGGGRPPRAGDQVRQGTRLPLRPRPNDRRLARASDLGLPALDARRRESAPQAQRED